MSYCLQPRLLRSIIDVRIVQVSAVCSKSKKNAWAIQGLWLWG